MDLAREVERLRRLVERLKTQETGVFVPLAAPLTSTSWDGDAFSTTAKTLIDLSTVFSAPAGMKAVYFRVAARDSASATTSPCWIMLSPVDTTNIGLELRVNGMVNDYYTAGYMIVPCDANGDIYYQIVASGASTMDVILQIWGYWR